MQKVIYKMRHLDSPPFTQNRFMRQDVTAV